MSTLTYTGKKIKQCTLCKTWLSVDQIIEDSNIVPIGMSFELASRTKNVFFFNHLTPECGTTFTVKVEHFTAYLDDSQPTELMANTSRCEEHCNNVEDLGGCQQNCFFAPYRQLLQKMISVKRSLRQLESMQPNRDSAEETSFGASKKPITCAS